MNYKQYMEAMTHLGNNIDVLELQMDRFRRGSIAHRRWAETAKKCVDYLEGRQWTEDEKAVLEEERRPCITRNKIAPLVRLMVGYFRQNKYDIEFLTGNDGTGLDEVAEALTAVAKQIAERNQAEYIDADVFADGIATGRGFWDVRLDFERNMLGEVAETLQDPFCTIIDPDADTYDPKSWGWVMTEKWLSPTDLFRLYGKRAVETMNDMHFSNWSVSNYADYDDQLDTPIRYFGQHENGLDDFDSTLSMYGASQEHINRTRRLVRTLDTQHRILKNCMYLVDLQTGVEKIIHDAWPREKIQRVIEFSQMKGRPVDVRNGLKKAVRWTTTAGDKILYDEWSPYDDFTIIPFFPYFRRGMTRGMINDLTDIQDEINKRASAYLHIIMTTANNGWMVEENSMEEEMEAALEEEGSAAGIIVKYKEGYSAPQKIEPSIAPTALEKLQGQDNSDIKEIASINDSALGNLDRVQSGRAIQARQKQSIIGAEVYFDNFARSRELKGRRYLSLIQNFYTEPRLIRIRGEDGEPIEYNINQRMANGEIANNLALGNYEIAIDEAPIAATFLQGQFEEALELRNMGVPIPDDVLVDLSSMPRKAQIKERINDQRLLQEDAQRFDAMAMRGQVGLPPDAPLPQVPVDGQSPVIIPQAQPMPMQGEQQTLPIEGI